MREVGIGAAARTSGVHVETIRYYERIGLVRAPPRSAAGQRRYGPAEIRRLRFVRRARELGFSLDEIRTLLGLADGGPACAEVCALALRHLAEIRCKIADLERMGATLAATAARCAGDAAPDCPILDALAGELPPDAERVPRSPSRPWSCPIGRGWACAACRARRAIPPATSRPSSPGGRRSCCR